MEKVSVIIPTFDRFDFLLDAIKSVKSQTYSNIEIIVINDGSTQKEYYEYDWSGVIMIHLPQNTNVEFGYPSPGYVRNKGIEQSTGKYIAFCDDDDIWFPSKLELQINAMKRTGCKMSSTEGIMGHGKYNPAFHSQYKLMGSDPGVLRIRYNYFMRFNINLFIHGYPEVFNKEQVQNVYVLINSAVIIEKEVLDKINNFKNMKPPGEDYDCYLRALDHTNVVYVKDVCMYYSRRTPL
jgi:glycosyltransferase involved in cell wall biosynthesis